MESIQERIHKYIDFKEVTPYKFCKNLGFSMGYLDKRGSIGTDKYLKIIEYYPEINPEWLLTGKGEMLKPTETTERPAVVVEPTIYTCESMLASVKAHNVVLTSQMQDKEEIILHLKEKIRQLEYNISILKKSQKPAVQTPLVAKPEPKLEKK